MKRFFVFLCLATVGLPLSAQTSAQTNDNKIKNVLFIISDDLKASVLGCYGDEICKTPNIDALAKRGMVFDRAYCQAMWCAPSRQSLMYSRYQGTGEIGGKNPNHINLGQHLQANGVHSARVGKIYHMRVPGDIFDGTDGADVASTWNEKFNTQGLEAHTPGDYACLNQNIFTTEMEGRQGARTKHRMFVTVEYDGDGSDQPDHKGATKAIELLQKNKDKPFFLAVGLVRPHYPNVAPRKYFEMYPWQDMKMPRTIPGDLDDIPKQGKTGTRSDQNRIGEFPDNQKRMWAGYYATVTFMDDQVGRIMAELDRLGLRDSTAVIFSSDHGYHLGEHLLWQKSNLHEEVTRVPLIVSAPGLPAGRTNAFSELIDIYPTVSNLLGLEIPDSVQGQSLVPVLKDQNATVREAALAHHRGAHFLRGKSWAYMQYGNKAEELYNMDSDPGQFNNLAFGEQAKVNEAKLAEMRSRLADRLKKAGVKTPARKKKKPDSQKSK